MFCRNQTSIEKTLKFTVINLLFLFSHLNYENFHFLLKVRSIDALLLSNSKIQKTNPKSTLGAPTLPQARKEMSWHFLLVLKAL